MKYQITLVGFLFLLLSSCAGVKPRSDKKIIEKEFQKFAKWVEKTADYDPYGNELVIDPDLLKAQYNQMIQKINSTPSISVSYRSVAAYKDHCKSYEKDWHCRKIRKAIRNSKIGYQWKDKALKRFVDHGVVVSMKSPPKGNINFGSYSVPIVLKAGLTGISLGFSSGTYLPILDHHFEIKKQGQKREFDPVASPLEKNSIDEGDITNRLKKLKELHKKGLINDEDFKSKKDELLKSL